MARRSGALGVTDLLHGIADVRDAIRALTAKVDEPGGASTQQ
jgi:hypothetical protein